MGQPIFVKGNIWPPKVLDQAIFCRESVYMACGIVWTCVASFLFGARRGDDMWQIFGLAVLSKAKGKGLEEK